MLKSSVPENTNNFICDKCDYKTSRYSQYQRHLSTVKHKSSVIGTKWKHLATFGNTKSSGISCACGKVYKDRTGLWKHRKICQNIETSDFIVSKYETK